MLGKNRQIRVGAIIHSELGPGNWLHTGTYPLYFIKDIHWECKQLVQNSVLCSDEMAVIRLTEVGDFES